MLDAVTLLPFSAAAGLGNVRGDVSVYASAACHCCAVNSFCDKGSACTCVKPQPSTAVVSLPVMSTGRHYAEFTLVAGLKGTVGVCRAGLFDPESTAGGVMATNWGWGFVALAGDGDHSQQQYRWKGQRGSAHPPPPPHRPP